MNELYQHKRSDTVKWVIVFLLVIALVGAVAALFVQVDRRTTTTVLGAEAYTIGALDAEGKATDSDASIVTRRAFSVEGLKAELIDGANVTYELCFYDEDGSFLSSTGALGTDFYGLGVPLAAKTFQIVITPVEDEDGKVSLTEVIGYADQVTVTIDR